MDNMMIKIDLEEAFDRLEWSFIRLSLQHLRFPLALINLIMSCVTTSSISILINGTPIPFFQPSRGIRQGNPLSPCLFIICMESLSRIIEHNVDICWWTPTRLHRNAHPLSHLVFADDLILLAQATTSNTSTIIEVFHQLRAKSSQRINYHKSKLYFSNNGKSNT